jgi:predicted DNA-binding protein (MmcQ/YjbR family)
MKDLLSAGEQLRSFALSLPEAYEETPWGHLAFKVKKKAFCFYGADETSLGMSVKLPISHEQALQEKWAEPTHYGLGKSGWVSVSFEKGDDVPVELLRGWLEESYKALAPKKLVKLLDQGAVAAAPARRRVAADPSLAIVSGDPRRADRAVKALGQEGIGAIGVGLDRVGALADAAPDVVVVDFGRTPGDALTCAQEIATYAEVVAAGLRDAKWEKRVKEGVDTVGRFREPPGDPRVVGFVARRRADAQRAVATKKGSRNR